ncbi:hypothetical protein [Streptomyces sp. BPTC-684]|uniref:hypothetical protein n=1 Tax=Streptomyces sp. BPTC-684 TaxID=3043734 RepID=UPI0024B04A00|nr:hypothetical protein [Streptomyces sp. BPTC-684]WHM36297.1 hypothetical protein QIY60_04705 [Streptomyces sp. BPTC-684]
MNRRTHAAAERATRRESLSVLLDRVQLGKPLTSAEAALLRAHVEGELADGDQARRSAAGQSAAVRREQQRTRAAEAAIVEAEQQLANALADRSQ